MTLQRLVDKGEGDSDSAIELRANITKRNMHLHPYENHRVTHDSDPHKAKRVEHAVIFHEHSPQKKKTTEATKWLKCCHTTINIQTMQKN